MKNIKKEWYDTRFPKYDNINLDEFNESEVEAYLALYSCYLSLFEKYLNKRLELFKIDQEFSKSLLSFEKVKEDDKDFYQAIASDELNYLYIRNNLYIERLTENELKYLGSKFDSSEEDINQIDFEFIESTFKKVIFENAIENGQMLLNFGPENGRFEALNNALIIGFRYDILANHRNNQADKAFEIGGKQSEFVEIKLTNLEKKTNEDLLIEGHVFIYDDFSTKKKDEFEGKLK